MHFPPFRFAKLVQTTSQSTIPTAKWFSRIQPLPPRGEGGQGGDFPPPRITNEMTVFMYFSRCSFFLLFPSLVVELVVSHSPSTIPVASPKGSPESDRRLPPPWCEGRRPQIKGDCVAEREADHRHPRGRRRRPVRQDRCRPPGFGVGKTDNP